MQVLTQHAEGIGPGARRLDLPLPGALDRVFAVCQQFQRFAPSLPGSFERQRGVAAEGG